MSDDYFEDDIRRFGQKEAVSRSVRDYFEIDNPAHVEAGETETGTLVWLANYWLRGQSPVLIGYGPWDDLTRTMERNLPEVRLKSKDWAQQVMRRPWFEYRHDFVVRVASTTSILADLDCWMAAPPDVPLIFDLRGVAVSSARVKLLRKRAHLILLHKGITVALHREDHLRRV